MIKNKTHAIINILGLTIGLSAFFLVFTVVIDELSYDKFWTNNANIYKVYWNDHSALHQKRPYSPEELGYALQQQFPEMEYFSPISTDDEYFHIDTKNTEGVHTRALIGNAHLITMLDLRTIDGTSPTFVPGHRNLLITESLYNKHFQKQDPIGKVIENIPTWNIKQETFLIIGIINDIPQNTHLRADVVILEKPTTSSLPKHGAWGGGAMYYQLKAGTDADVFTKKMNGWVNDYIETPRKEKKEYGLQPLREVYLNSDYDTKVDAQGNKNSIYILTAVGILLLLIACIDFVNLSLARAIKRLKETGVRKVLGAQRRQLIGLFLMESFLFFFIATILSLGAYALVLPWVENFMGNGLSHSILEHLYLFGTAILLIFGISLSTGIYPAWVLSNFKPVDSLRGQIYVGQSVKPNSLYRTLVVIQFAIAIFTLLGLLIVHEQKMFLDRKDIGYDRENLLHIGLRSWEGKGATFKTELAKMPGIESASIANWDIVKGKTAMSYTMPHPLKEGERIKVEHIFADFDFIGTLGFDIQQGRDFDISRNNDHYDQNAQWTMDREAYTAYINSRSTIIPASTAKALGIHGAGIALPKLGYSPVGIIEDFHLESLHQPLTPTLILASLSPEYAHMFIRTTPGKAHMAKQSLSKVWKDIYPNRVLEVQWVTDILNKQYQAERQQQVLFFIFSGLMLFLSTLGLFALIVHTTEQRIKEIGIRKVLGASTQAICTMLSREFVKLILLAILIACPIAWWLMNKWLENFAYRIAISWNIFVIAGILAILVALLTVVPRSLFAARRNPVDSLRDE